MQLHFRALSPGKLTCHDLPRNLLLNAADEPEAVAAHPCLCSRQWQLVGGVLAAGKPHCMPTSMATQVLCCSLLGGNTALLTCPVCGVLDGRQRRFREKQLAGSKGLQDAQQQGGSDEQEQGSTTNKGLVLAAVHRCCLPACC